MNVKSKIRVRLTFISPILGSCPSNPEIYRKYVASKSPDADGIEEEVAQLGVDGVIDKTMTVFPRVAGKPVLLFRQLRGFFKAACKAARKCTDAKNGDWGYESKAIKAYVQVIDTLIFMTPREVPIMFNGEVRGFERPLRASTPQGERIALANSEEIPKGATVEFEIQALTNQYESAIREWLDYGVFSGLLQFRNGGYGRFVWEEIDEMGNVIGGNKAEWDKINIATV